MRTFDNYNKDIAYFATISNPSVFQDNVNQISSKVEDLDVKEGESIVCTTKQNPSVYCDLGLFDEETDWRPYTGTFEYCNDDNESYLVTWKNGIVTDSYKKV